MANQIANSVAGDQAGRDIVKNYLPVLTGMSRLIQEYGDEQGQAPKITAFIQKLQHFYGVATEGDVRGLDEKLSAAGRQDQLQFARRAKHEAAQFVLKHQSSLAAQKIITHVFAKIFTEYQNTVVPLIQANADRLIVDKAIQQVLDAGWLFLETNPLDIDLGLLHGLLYFLGGNCHLRWDPAC
jgi:hypothetical protein